MRLGKRAAPFLASEFFYSTFMFIHVAVFFFLNTAPSNDSPILEAAEKETR